MMISSLSRTLARRRVLKLLLTLALLPLTARSTPQELKRRPASQAALPNKLQDSDLISHHKLAPFLHGNALLRFSSDGNYMLAQDAAGLFVLTVKPLQIRFYADIAEAYPAQFSADSKMLLVLNYDLTLFTWHLSEPDTPEKRDLKLGRGCLDAKLSPDAAWLACLTVDEILDVYRTNDMQRVYTQRVRPTPGPTSYTALSVYRESPFSGPFGFVTSRDLVTLANRGLFRAPILFSPDFKYALLTDESAAYRLELPTFSKSSIPGALHKRAADIRAILPGDRVLLAEPKKESVCEVVSLSTGEVLSPATFPGAIVSLATNAQYALVSQFDSPGATVFDLAKNQSLQTPPNLSADVYGDELALFTADGGIWFYRVGENRPLDKGRLPLAPLPLLRSALADSTLSTLMLSVAGGAAAFDLATGNRLGSLASFRGASFASPESAFLLNPKKERVSASVLHWTRNEPAAPVSANWNANASVDLIPSRSALLEYSFHNELGRGLALIGFNGEIPFNLRALDPTTGRELWHRGYWKDSPTPFSDPQGARVAIGWKASSDGAHNVAKEGNASREAYKKQKIKDMDSFFEVLDVATGKSLGGVLVQFGSGPASFDFAFSEGDLLFLVKDTYRVSVFRLSDGNLLARLRGQSVTANAAAKLFAIDEGNGRLSLYQSDNAAKLADRPLPDHIEYLCFSENGDRLLVLTTHQQIFVLDVKQTIAAYPASATQDPANP